MTGNVAKKEGLSAYSTGTLSTGDFYVIGKIGLKPLLSKARRYKFNSLD